MPFSQWLLFHVPILPLGIIIIVIAVVLSIVGMVIVRRIVPHHILKSHNDLAGSIFEGLAVAYTVLLAFVVVISWQNFDKATAHVETEANCLVDLYRSSAAFEKPFSGQLQTLIKDYARAVVGEEWKMLAKGQESMQARMILRDIWGAYTSYEPKSEKEKIFFAESVRKLDDLRENRRLRIVDAGTGIHPVLWFILIVGALTTISFTFFFGSDSFAIHVIMASMLAIIIFFILFMILLFDFPYTGSVVIDPGVFQQVITY